MFPVTNYVYKEQFDYLVSYARPDSSTNSPFAVAASFATKIQTKLLSLAKKYYRIGSANVQDEILIGSLVSAANIVESLIGMVTIPKAIDVSYLRFPYSILSFEIPRGPVLLNDSDALAAMTLKYTTDGDAPLSNSLNISIADDTPGSAYVKLYHDNYVPSLSLKTGYVWPVPLYTEAWPIKFSAIFGMFNPTYWDASSETQIMVAYNEPLTTLFQLGLHLYENRMPVGTKADEIPMTYRMLILNMKR